ncbi:MAG: AMP-binding protein [Bryobacterales bacterium]|nr:AMP-binding protein [Bryobacterales bacterium]MBV9400389.1 AMP-binding protein [Bryobacterales bacterium]
MSASHGTVWSVLEATAAKIPEENALRQPTGGGQYRCWTWREYADTVRQIAVGLRSIGVRQGDVIALQSETRAEFYLADLAVIASGAIAAALYTSVPYEEQVNTVRICGARVIFVENEKALRGLKGAGAELTWILLTGSSAGCKTLEEIRAEGRRTLESDPGAFDRILAGYNAAALAVLYMTSGATGTPKIGMVTHRALVSNIEMGPTVLPLSPKDSTIAFLPSAHIAQRVVMELLPIYEGACVWFSESLSKLPHELRSIRPTFFLAPPRVWERVYATISAEIRKRPAPIKKLFYAGLGIGAEAARLREQGKAVPRWMRIAMAFFDRVIFSKIRRRLGGRLRIAASGAAPLGKDLAEFYAAIGMPLIEGYGLTEGGVAMLNPLDRPKAGSIGRLLPGVEARIDADGELLLKTPCVFSGYYNDPAATAAVLRDGWLATGDIAEKDNEGYFYITGRKKEIIVSSNGKKIYPSRIEALLKREPLISQVLLIGDNLPYVTALVTVSGSPDKAHPAVEQAVQTANRELPSFEQVRRFKILDREFSIEAGELTPTMKLRRAKALENHHALVRELYAGRDLLQ